MAEPFHNQLNDKMTVKSTVNVSRIVTMYYFDCTADYHSALEYHDFWEFVYVDLGHVIATADNNTFEINKGEIVFHKPNEVHSVRCDGVTPANIFIMTFVCKSPVMKFFNNKLLSVPYRLQGILAAIVEEMQAAYGENPGWIKNHVDSPLGAEQMIKSYLEMFLIMLARATTPSEQRLVQAECQYFENTAQSKPVADAIQALESNIYRQMSIDELCRITNYGKSQLCGQFKRATGKTVMEYFTELKIREAKMLMREQRLNNSQISDALGFSSPQYFIRMFKQHTGMTPGEYKKSVKFR